MPMARAMPDTVSGPRRTEPSTCQRAAVRPTGRVRSSATARTCPLSRSVVTATPLSSSWSRWVMARSRVWFARSRCRHAVQLVEAGRIVQAVELVPGRQDVRLVHVESGEDLPGELHRGRAAAGDEV